ncbi:DUF7331 family protein [Natronomonas sp. EA1]|uniref:DUF7331 family protein n=1 Tax=Natronomonas sp. EA1 TaxID=3421655 RepID=UPI003EBC74A9
MIDDPPDERLDPMEAALPDYHAVTGYRDGSTFVLCEKSNANAWIRSDVTASLER